MKSTFSSILKGGFHLLCVHVTISVIIPQTTAENDYCKLNDNHTMCLYKDVSPKCRQGVFRNGVSATDQKIILEVHNKLRTTVAAGGESRGNPGPQPKATNMQQLQWDPELATIAQRWADQCDYKHDVCRTVDRYQVGQNIAMSATWPCTAQTNTDPDWPNMIKLWYDEVAEFDSHTVGNYSFKSNTGHYTQVVWAKTNRTGCGYTMFQEGNLCKKYYVCNYGPAGNYIGEPIYETPNEQKALRKHSESTEESKEKEGSKGREGTKEIHPCPPCPPCPSKT